MLDTDASPLKKVLLQSGLCKQVSSTIDVEITEIPVTIQMRGCDESSADRLEEILFTALRKIVKDGLSPQAVENAIHQLEFHRSEITGDYAPFGLSLFMRSALLNSMGAMPKAA